MKDNIVCWVAGDSFGSFDETASVTEASFGSFHDAAPVGRKERTVPILTEASLAFSRKLSDCTDSTATLIYRTGGEERFSRT